MKLYRCYTPRVGTRREVYLGHWYAPSAREAQALARAWQEHQTSAPYTKPVGAAPSSAHDKAYNSENQGGMPKAFTPESINRLLDK